MRLAAALGVQGMSLKLFEITAQLREFEKISESEDIPAEVIRDTLEALSGDFETKAVNVAKFILELESRAYAIANAAKRQAERAKRIEKRADAIRAYLLWSLQCVDRKKIETEDLVIRRQENPVAVHITDEKLLPVNFWYQPPPPPPQIDKKALKEALQSGADVSGAFLEQGEHVRIIL